MSTATLERIDWTNAHSADGPTLAAWFREHLPTTNREDASLLRILREWEHGGKPSFATVDGWMIRLGRHVSELPDEVWRQEETRRYNEPHPLRGQGFDLLEQQTPIREISRRLNVAPSTVRGWRKVLDEELLGERAKA